MKTKDDLLLEQAYLKVLNEKLRKENFPNKIDPDTLGSEEKAIQIEYDGNLYFVDLEYYPPRVMVNIGDDPEDHIVEITSENNLEVYQRVVTHATEKQELEKEEEEFRNPTDPNEDNPFV